MRRWLSFAVTCCRCRDRQPIHLVVIEVNRAILTCSCLQARELIVSVIDRGRVGIVNCFEPVQSVVIIGGKDAIVICALLAIADRVVSITHRHSAARHSPLPTH